jgi:hypothetical protein
MGYIATNHVLITTKINRGNMCGLLPQTWKLWQYCVLLQWNVVVAIKFVAINRIFCSVIWWFHSHCLHCHVHGPSPYLLKLPTSCNRKNTTEENIYMTDATKNVSLIDQYHKINTSILKNIRKYFPWWICMSYLYHTTTRKNVYKFKMVIRKINHERHGLLFSYVLKKGYQKGSHTKGN